MMLTNKESAEFARLNKKLFGGKGTRKEVLRALDLKRKHNADYRNQPDYQESPERPFGS